MIQVGNVVDQAQILKRVQVRHRRRVDMQGREWEDTGCLPLGDRCLDLGSPHEIGLIGGGRAVCVGHLYVVVRTADLVLGTVAAESRQCQYAGTSCFSVYMYIFVSHLGSVLCVAKWHHKLRDTKFRFNVPLRKVLITTNVSTLAGFTALTGLGVAK